MDERQAAETVKRTQADIRGPIPLPTEKHRYTVIRGPHVHKDSREHFEMRIHKRLIDILDSRPQTIDALTKLDLPAGGPLRLLVEKDFQCVTPREGEDQSDQNADQCHNGQGLCAGLLNKQHQIRALEACFAGQEFQKGQKGGPDEIDEFNR